MLTNLVNASLDPELRLIRDLAKLVLDNKVSARLSHHNKLYGGTLDSVLSRTYWELGYGQIHSPGRLQALMTIGINPSENQLIPEAAQPWGLKSLEERIECWRKSDAWTLGIEERLSFERENSGLDFGQPHTWAYFHRLRRLFRAAGYEDLLKGSYNTNISKFTSPDLASIQADFEAEAEACLPTLAQQVRLVSPSVITVIGVSTLGTSKNKPGLLRFFHQEGGKLRLTATNYGNGKRQYQSGTGTLPGVTNPILVVVLPHTSGYAHLNFDPYFDDLTALLRRDLNAAGL